MLETLTKNGSELLGWWLVWLSQLLVMVIQYWWVVGGVVWCCATKRDPLYWAIRWLVWVRAWQMAAWYGLREGWRKAVASFDWCREGVVAEARYK